MLINTNFKFYWNSLTFLDLGICCQIKVCPRIFFCLICISWHYCRNSLELIFFLLILRCIEILLYLKSYKWLLSHNERRIDFLGYRPYDGLAKHIKPFFKKHESESKSVLWLNLMFHVVLKYKLTEVILQIFYIHLTYMWQKYI